MKLKVNDEKYKEFAEKVAACFEGAEGVYNWRDLDVEVREYDEGLHVTVSQMYEYLPMNLDIMLKLADVFGTRKYGVNQWSHGGCETCDYGSKYAHEFHVPKQCDTLEG